MNKNITLEEFKKFANENDILWFYNKPKWRSGNSGRCYTKEQVKELRKMWLAGDWRDYENKELNE